MRSLGILHLSLFILSSLLWSPRGLLAQTPETALEPVVQLTIPFDLIRRKTIEILETPGSQVVEVTRLEMDPIRRLMMFEAVLELPANFMQSLDEFAGQRDSVPVRHRIALAYELPHPRVISANGTIVLRFVQFKIDGQSYIDSFGRLSQFLVAILDNTSFMDWIYTKVPIEDLNQHLGLRVQQFLNSKDLVLKGQMLALKMDMRRIPQLREYAELGDLQFWAIHPVVIRGSQNRIALRLEAGIGKPHPDWLKAAEERLKKDEVELLALREQRYQQLGQVQDLIEKFEDEISQWRNQVMVLSPRDERRLEAWFSQLRSRASEALNSKDPLFLAYPDLVFAQLDRDLRADLKATFAELERSMALEQEAKNDGIIQNRGPMVRQRFSQLTLDQMIRSAREFDFNGEQLFSEIYVAMSPSKPGLIIRGVANADLAYFMSLGLEGEGVVFGEAPWRLAKDTYGAGIPFELSLNVKMLDQSELAVDVESLRLLEGSEAIRIHKYSQHGQVLINFAQMALAQTFAGMILDTSRFIPDMTRKEQRQEEEQKILQGIYEIRDRYLQSRPSPGVAGLGEILDIDLRHNPFRTAGVDFLTEKGKILFSELVRYDSERQLIIIKVSPSLVSQAAFGIETTAQVWNIEPIVDSKQNRNYLEFALGDGPRTQSYVQEIHSRQEYQDGQAGLITQGEASPSDMQLLLHLNELEEFINKLLAKAYRIQEREVGRELLLKNELETWLIKDFKVKVPADGQLQFEVTFEKIHKYKRGVIPRFFGSDRYAVDREATTVTGRFDTSVEQLQIYQADLDRFSAKYNSENIYLGKELLRLDVLAAGLRFSGDIGLFQKIANLALGKGIDFKKTPVHRWVKRMILNFANKYLQVGFSSGSRGLVQNKVKKLASGLFGLETEGERHSHVVSGISVNKYAMLYTHEEEILLQLHPHLLSQAFEIRLLPNQSFAGNELGLVLRQSTNTASIDFTSNAAMANVDKAELIAVTQLAEKEISPYLDADKDTLDREAYLLYDRVFFRSDRVGTSLFRRMQKVIELYGGLANLSAVPSSIIDDLYGDRADQHRQKKSGFVSTELTVSGAELMYVAAAAWALKYHADRLMERMQAVGSNPADTYQKLQLYSEVLEGSYIKPLMETYQKEFAVLNAKILAQGITDWNQSFYPDAAVAQKVFEHLKEQNSIR